MKFQVDVPITTVEGSQVWEFEADSFAAAKAMVESDSFEDVPKEFISEDFDVQDIVWEDAEFSYEYETAAEAAKEK